tara:strand:- start:4125 stop:4784 length:660 start_codon:yes stop_codon:yes gene_type:complete
MGRRTKFTEPVKQQIIEVISIGGTYDIAAERAGITRGTLYNWIRAGLKAGTGKKYEFVQAIKKAESRSAVAALATIQMEVKKGNLKAAFFILERRHNYKRDEFHIRSDHLIDEDNSTPATLKDVLIEQAKDLKIAMQKASKKDSFQAYAALQRQLLHIYQQIQNIEADENQLDSVDNFTSDQLLNEISNIIVSLPPLARQKIRAELEMLNKNVIPMKQL